MKRSINTRNNRHGILLLVVLSALTFFSLLIAAYMVFSTESRQTAFAMSNRTTRAPDIDWVMDEALMTLIRGTDDVNNPFYGESILADYYGITDGTQAGQPMKVVALQGTNYQSAGPLLMGDGFVRFPAYHHDNMRFIDAADGSLNIDDLYSNRVITFTQGPLRNRSFRVIRSTYVVASTGEWLEHDSLYVDLPEDLIDANAGIQEVFALFYRDTDGDGDVDATDTAAGGYEFVLNGAPRNSRGIGLSGTQIDQDVGDNPTQTQFGVNPSLPTSTNTGPNPPVGYDAVAVSLQPNHLGSEVDKSQLGGDFDESYDAADYNNWFLSHTTRTFDASGTLRTVTIPSFHRPSIINYLLNEETDWSSAGNAEFSNIVASLQRSTFRPLPLANNALSGGSGILSPSFNSRFTGGIANYALRSPISLPTNTTELAGRLDQLAKALTEGPFDVDNDLDGFAESIWIDLRLPMMTAPDGRLIRPLIAPMIEDLGGRLNVNAHHSPAVSSIETGVSSTNARYAQTRRLNEIRRTFRGLGHGPAEISILAKDALGNDLLPAVITETNQFITSRYQTTGEVMGGMGGRAVRDALDAIRNGARPATHTSSGMTGYAEDTLGRGGYGLGHGGELIAAESGTVYANNGGFVIDEAQNDPYESDPSGDASGDNHFSYADLEALLRYDEFGNELLSQELQGRLRTLLNNNEVLAKALTTASRSDDTPTFNGEQSALIALVRLMNRIDGSSGPLTDTQVARLIAPELRLGRKLDVNRPFGNGIDDNGNGIIDEPNEVLTAVPNQAQPLVPDVPRLETQSFVVGPGVSGTIPSSFLGWTPNYLGDDKARYIRQFGNWTNGQDALTDPFGTAPAQPVITGRQMLARHLYVLMMAVSRDLQSPTQRLAMPVASLTDATDIRNLEARRLAQWAVNVVDYRDQDGIMTRFVFDETPFGMSGWSPPAEPAPIYNVVWGAERPELIMTENLALHDVRLDDTDLDSGDGTDKVAAMMPDDDSDQVRMPQGSFMLELMCPRPVVNGDETTKPGIDQALFSLNTSTNEFELNLAATAPARTGAMGAPVWRVAISEPHYAMVGAATGSGNEALDPETLRNVSGQDTVTFQPESIEIPLSRTATPTPLSYDRFITFVPFDDAASNPNQVYNEITTWLNNNAITDMQPDQVFFAPDLGGWVNQDLTLEPGQYATLAPRFVTNLGSKTFGGAVPGVPSEQRFELIQNEGLVQFDPDGNRMTPPLGPAAGYTGALPIMIGTVRPNGWPLDIFPNDIVGLNVSEPLPRRTYYRQPGTRYNTADVDSANGDDYPLTDAYVDMDTGASTALDEPEDIRIATATGVARVPVDSSGTGAEPFLGTVPQHCSVFLQRLADPTRPYDRVLNPYRTVDYMPVDLSVISGEGIPTDINPIVDSYARGTRQKNGGMKDASGTVQSRASIFSYETQAPALETASPPTREDFFSFTGGTGAGGAVDNGHIKNSFSFLNTSDRLPVGTAGIVTVNEGFAGFGRSLGTTRFTSFVGNERNFPFATFARHPWLDRPFASSLELMMVPASSSGRLFEDFSLAGIGNDPMYPDSGNGNDPVRFNSPARHLINFFFGNEAEDEGTNYHRLFDLVHTLPRFRGEVEMIDPNRLNGANGGEQNQINEFTSLLRPPFNLRYDNQREATINMNTIGEFPVWAGLIAGHASDDELDSYNGGTNQTQLAYSSFQNNRRGYPAALGNTPVTGASGLNGYHYGFGLDPRYPTQFAGVYKRQFDGTFAPELASRSFGSTDQLQRREVHTGLLRGVDALANGDVIEQYRSNPNSMHPFFVRENSQAVSSARDRTKNPFLAYQTLMRMPNLVADNSQVFLIRMTVGFFEVDPNDTASVGAEYLSDTGQNQRYRGLFIVDRSIPVGFQPGEDLNARDVVVFESRD
ncbi:MAG: hypothetical protein AB8B91_03365 [Rubripirellula sp.]